MPIYKHFNSTNQEGQYNNPVCLKTDKHYIGFANGEHGGIWGRWSSYVQTKHGGNKLLVELIAADPDSTTINILFSFIHNRSHLIM